MQAHFHVQYMFGTFGNADGVVFGRWNIPTFRLSNFRTFLGISIMSRASVSRYLLIIIAVVAGFWLIERMFQLVYRIADILLIFGLAWLLKLLVDPMIRRLHRWHIPRPGAILIAYLLVIGGLVSGLIWLIPQLTLLTQKIPLVTRQVTAQAEQVALWLQERGVLIDPNTLTSQIAGAGATFARVVAQQAITLAQSFVGVVGRIALVITISIYMSLTADRVVPVMRPVIPPRWRDEFDAFMRDVDSTYSSYIRGYFYVFALGVLMSAAVLFGFGVPMPNALLWLLAVALLRLLPFVGGTLANALLFGVFVFTLPLSRAIPAIALILVGQLVLTNVLMPRVMSRELGINPLLVLLAVLLGGRIYGLAGILFAVPAAAIISTIIGKAVKRYLLPLYETSGWWMDDVPLTTPAAETADQQLLTEVATQPLPPDPPPPHISAEPKPAPRASRSDAPI
jgi:predicted PurR-regulated permease PerM